jgi:pimeloyl-ACP methyl ester carboxylesterase
MTPVGSTRDERPVFIPALGEELFGIITEPTVEPNGIGLVLLAGGTVPAPNRNRLSVRIARRVAALGFHTLRFDYRGVGESTGVTDSYRLDRPFVDDALAAVRCFEENGVRDIVLAGTCFGARTALATAARVPGLRGVALLAPPIRDFEMGTLPIEATPTSTYVKKAFRMRNVRGLLDPQRRRTYARIARTKLRAGVRSGGARLGPARGVASPAFAEPFAELGPRGTPVLLAYGTEDEFYDMFREARHELAATLDAPGSRIEVQLVPGEIHGLSRLAVQDEVTRLIVEWLAGLNDHTVRPA